MWAGGSSVPGGASSGLYPPAPQRSTPADPHHGSKPGGEAACPQGDPRDAAGDPRGAGEPGLEGEEEYEDDGRKQDV